MKRDVPDRRLVLKVGGDAVWSGPRRRLLRKRRILLSPTAMATAPDRLELCD
jgi:hypothetical protein